LGVLDEIMTNSKILKNIVFCFIVIFLLTSSALAEDTIIKIGVLAKRGAERSIEKWSPTAEYLSNKLPGKKIIIVPLIFEQIYTVVEKGEVDFILANPSFYVELENLYKVNRIATLKNNVIGEDIRGLSDLKKKSFMAVSETSFGGWRTAWRELKETGINPFKDFASISFGGTHDAVIYAVRDGKVDAGTVRTDTLERMTPQIFTKLS
jgi:ABC-type phosphate/phosphonate transport system substrate-binding protein